MWIKHHNFIPNVRESWDLYCNSRGMVRLLEKLNRLKYTLKEWNILDFRNIFSKIEHAQHAVEKAENSFDENPSVSNLILLKRENANLTLTLAMEEDFWKQKSNVQWTVEGERNSRFFHHIVKKKRQKNSIHTIRLDGNVSTDPKEISNSAVAYFKNSFDEDNSCRVDFDPTIIPSIIMSEMNMHLCDHPTSSDIRICVFDIDGDSCAGPDGYNAKFFQVCWDIIGGDVCEAVWDFFSRSQLPRAFCTTSIFLIPKNSNPQSWKDFRPISLCNTTYKIISKILSGRLAKLLPLMINPAQSGFIKGRNITDNILTAHEVTHDISQSITNTIIKLDMEKSYDRINWNFIIQVMTRFGFSIVWINFIKTCISNCWFSILVNGQSAGFFRSKRGLRQGDPLSPLLFVVAVDYFSRCLDRLFNNNPSMFYKLKKKVKITHLAYADDILIFTIVSTKNLHILKNCFSHFERVSVQKINGNKSSFILYKPTAQLVEWVKSILVFNKADLPINYLGVPLWKGFQSFKMYDSLISKIQKKILTWNHHMLSTGGRLELINSVLNSIALYNLQVIKPPDNVLPILKGCSTNFYGDRMKINGKCIGPLGIACVFPRMRAGWAVGILMTLSGLLILNYGGDFELRVTFGLISCTKNTARGFTPCLSN
ncbi:hypothetical protein OROMI_001343 [Orobanche minor]